jgi:hypothetical protein
MIGFAGLATTAHLNDGQFKQLREAIDSSPILPDIIESDTRVETYYALDAIMQCIRGNAAHIMRAQAGELDDKTAVDLGDVSKTDWDVLMKEANRASEEQVLKLTGKPFAARMPILDVSIKQAAADKSPASTFFEANGRPVGIPAVEAFLKLRQGELRESYSQRIGQWLATGDPGQTKPVLMLQERGKVDRELAILAVAIAEYQQSKGGYPATLKDLGPKGAFVDPFSGKEIVYRREGSGYVLYSFGLNQKDDNGDGDDRAIKAER